MDHFQQDYVLPILLGFSARWFILFIFLHFHPRVHQYVWPAVNCMVIFSFSFLSQIIKQLYSKNNLEKKTMSLYGYHHYAVLHLHKKKYLLLNLFFFTFASVALKVSIKSVVLSLLVGCLKGPKAVFFFFSQLIFLVLAHLFKKKGPLY